MSKPALDEYRRKALELCARANEQRDPQLRVEYENLAFLYIELAETIERGTGSGSAR